MSVKREIRQGWETLRWEVCYLDSEYLGRTIVQFPKKAVAFFDKWMRTSNGDHHNKWYITGNEKQQMLYQDVVFIKNL